MRFLFLLAASVAAVILRFRFGVKPISAFGTYEAFAHILVGALCWASLDWYVRGWPVAAGYPLRRQILSRSFALYLLFNPFLFILVAITLVEALRFFGYIG